ncbi:DUF3293 domain-containing protein [Pseudoalteromonas sp. A25]|uniref:DUF3293 domain-containing protein n=1 Tax=Pseudoalteromonas sp. A25 TaxID=116092 RepID=UPI001561BFAA|nr:DUF3293 domain-containing protein [Pseudoalteromonas sp. A25]
MISEHLWQVYQQVYFQSCVFSNTLQAPSNHSINHKHGCIISLWNPRGAKCTKLTNRLMAKKVCSRLKALGYRYDLLWGGDRRMAYKELSAFVSCTLMEAKEIASHSEQLAFYYVSHRGMLWLVRSDDIKFKKRVCKDIQRRMRITVFSRKNLAFK